MLFCCALLLFSAVLLLVATSQCSSVLLCFALLLLCYSAQCYSAVLLLVASAQCGVKRTRTEARHPASAYHHANNCCFLSHYLLFAVFYLGPKNYLLFGSTTVHPTICCFLFGSKKHSVHIPQPNIQIEASAYHHADNCSLFAVFYLGPKNYLLFGSKTVHSFNICSKIPIFPTDICQRP